MRLKHNNIFSGCSWVHSEQGLYQWYKPKSLFFMFSYRNLPFFFFLLPLAEHPCRPLVPAGLFAACGHSNAGCTILARAAIWPPGKRAQPRGLEPSAVLSGVQHGAKKYPKKTLSRHLILSNSSVSPDQIGNIPSHKPLQVCFGQEVRNDGFIPDVF